MRSDHVDRTENINPCRLCHRFWKTLSAVSWGLKPRQKLAHSLHALVFVPELLLCLICDRLGSEVSGYQALQLLSLHFLYQSYKQKEPWDSLETPKSFSIWDSQSKPCSCLLSHLWCFSSPFHTSCVAL